MIQEFDGRGISPCQICIALEESLCFSIHTSAMRSNYASNEKAFYYSCFFDRDCDCLKSFSYTNIYTSHDILEGHNDHSFGNQLLRYSEHIKCFFVFIFVIIQGTRSTGLLFQFDLAYPVFSRPKHCTLHPKMPLSCSSNDSRAGSSALITRAQTARAHDRHRGNTRQLKRTKRTRNGDSRSRLRNRNGR